YGKIEPAAGTLSYSNAGHNPPMLVRASGETLWLDVGGLPIGMMPGTGYREGQVDMQPGDSLVIYSDGITESVDGSGEECGEDRVHEVVQGDVGRAASGIRDRVEEVLSRFVGNAAPVDDMTLMIVKHAPA